jgi:uracil-DNA glycosylase
MSAIAIVGEAWGENEERERAPFVGAAGYELTRMLNDAGIRRADCFLTNVFNVRPRGNKIEELCGTRADGIPGYTYLSKGKYVDRRYAGELNRLADELIEEDPNVIIALGNTPLWALTNTTGITKVRGTTMLSTHCVSGFKVLPTFHPAAILRAWENRSIAVIDLAKARREAEFPEIRRTRREIIIEPSLEDIRQYVERCLGVSQIAVDVETAGRQITCLGLSVSRVSAIVIPFEHPRRPGKNYWPSAEAEIEVWNTVRPVLEQPRPTKVFQNGLYDITFFWRGYGIAVRGAEDDDMLLHHALQPESLKSLGFLGSIYGNERAWKGMRQRVKTTVKGDDE